MKSLFIFAASALLFALSVNAAGGKKKESIEEISRDAYVWGYPAVLMAHARESILGKTRDPEASMNHFFYSDTAPDPFLGQFIPVNPENLYGWAWVDLSKEPLVMTQPRMDDRYYSVQFVDAYSNVFHTISNNTQGEKPGVFVITPPDWKGDLPINTIQIRASTPEILILAQTFIKDAKEVPKAAKLTTQRQLIPLSSWNKGIQADPFKSEYPTTPLKINKNLAAGGLKFYQELSHIMTKNPPPTKAEIKEAEHFFAIGLNTKTDFDKFSSDPEVRKSLERGIFEGEREIQARLAAGFGVKINGWSYELKSPPFTEDPLLRAATSQRYLFSVPPEESIQLSLDFDSEDRQLTSLYRYVLHFEKDDFPPARKMWSVRVHELTSKNQDEMARAISVINDKKANLKYNKDGSVDILVQREKPDKVSLSNWLPLSRDANFYLILTLFNPNNSAINRKYVAPSLIRLEEGHIPKQRVTHTMMADVEGL